MPIIAAVVLGVMIGWVSGGNLRGIGDIRIAHPVAIGVLFAVQAIARSRYFESGVGVWGLLLWALISAVLAATVAMSGNRGLRLAGVGMLLNLVVVLANGGMPVEASVTAIGGSGFYQASSSATHLLWLGDVLRLPLPGGDLMLSAGDVLLLVGVQVAIVESIAHSSDNREPDAEEAG